MRRIGVVMGLLALGVMAGPAQAYLFFENFENGLANWTKWTQRVNVDASGLQPEGAALGNIVPESGANASVLRIGGSNFNGGYYQVITGLPTNEDLTINGFWRHASTFQTNKDWEEVQVIEGAINYTPGNDITGNLEYKNDSFDGHPNFPVGGLMSDFAPTTNDGVFQTASGTVTVVLKYGNGTGSTQIWAEFDDIYITPEPVTLGLVGLGGLVLIRRRRA